MYKVQNFWIKARTAQVLRGGTKSVIHYSMENLTNPIHMGLLGAAHGWGGGKKKTLSKICHIHATMIKLLTVIPYLNKIQKKYKSLDILIKFC